MVDRALARLVRVALRNARARDAGEKERRQTEAGLALVAGRAGIAEQLRAWWNLANLVDVVRDRISVDRAERIVPTVATVGAGRIAEADVGVGRAALSRAAIGVLVTDDAAFVRDASEADVFSTLRIDRAGSSELTAANVWKSTERRQVALHQTEISTHADAVGTLVGGGALNIGRCRAEIERRRLTIFGHRLVGAKLTGRAIVRVGARRRTLVVFAKQARTIVVVGARDAGCVTAG